MDFVAFMMIQRYKGFAIYDKIKFNHVFGELMRYLA